VATDSFRVLVTGGAGFIGSHCVDLLLERGVHVTVLDNLTYAGSLLNLAAHESDPRFRFVRADVTDPQRVETLVGEADRVVHAAAESFVDRSIAHPTPFVETNVVGTHVMLEACRKSGTPMVFISTDEVYGSRREGAFCEDDPLRPNSPYAASKAGADLLCRSYAVTYGTPVTVVRGTNAFGPRQHPEKAIPTFTLAALQGKRIPIYGNGSNRREWLHVEDFARAIVTVMDEGEPGSVYNIGGGHELTNLELAKQICQASGAAESLIAFVEDRPGHDFRYGVTWDRIRSLGWDPKVSFEEGLASTVRWYRQNLPWTKAVQAGGDA
jgi:dTDP-glucose 4,6-dehydratase